MDKRKNALGKGNLPKIIGKEESIIYLIFGVGHTGSVSDLSVCRMASNGTDRLESNLLYNKWQPYLAQYP